MTTPHIVALGSSFAAGAGIEPVVDRAAWRSGNNYAHLLARKLNARLTDLTRSGATLLQVLDQPQRNVFSMSTSPPQLDALPADADIITLTAGGNDLGYSAGMIGDAYRASLQSVPLLNWLIPTNTHEDGEPHDVEEVTRRFISIIDRIRAIAPQAKVYLVSYLTIFGPDATSSPDNPLTAGQIKHFQRLGDALQQAYEAAAKARPEVVLVDVAAASQAHGVGSKEPWVTAYGPLMLLRGQAPYHPNAAGHVAVAVMLHEQIRAARELS